MKLSAMSETDCPSVFDRYSLRTCISIVVSFLSLPVISTAHQMTCSGAAAIRKSLSESVCKRMVGD